jgi:hypothetical protein
MGFPSAAALPLDRARVRNSGETGGNEPRALCYGPNLPFIAPRDKGPPAIYLGWASLIRMRSRARLAFGPIS